MRLFVAFDVPSMIRRDLEQRTLACRQELPAARWVRAASLHLTLVFIGQAAAAQADDLDRELALVFAARAQMRMRLMTIDAFPPRGKARVVWLGLETTGDLGALRDEVAAVVERIVEVEVDRRPFRPHLTLARCRSPWPPSAVDRLAARFDAEDPLASFPVAEGLLLSSELLPTGARYSSSVVILWEVEDDLDLVDPRVLPSRRDLVQLADRQNRPGAGHSSDG